MKIRPGRHLGRRRLLLASCWCWPGLLANSAQARWIDFAFGFGLAIFGLTFLKEKKAAKRTFSIQYEALAWMTGVTCLLVCTAVAQERDSAWLLPNLDMRLSVQVSNPGKEAAKTLATISVADARRVAPEFPGRLAFALALDKSGRFHTGYVSSVAG